MNGDIEKLTEDGKVTKRIIKEGYGDKPTKNSRVTVHYDGYLQKTGFKFDSSRDRQQSFTVELSEDKVIDAWTIAIQTMKLGEIAEIITSYKYGYGEKGQFPIVPTKAKLRYEIELLAFSDMAESVEQGIQFALNKKNEGTELLKKNQYELALHSYLAGREYVLGVWNCTFEELMECKKLTIQLQLNISLCYMKLRRWDDALIALNYVLERDPSNVKAYYRIGQVYMETLDYDKGIEIIKEGLKEIPDDGELKKLLAIMEKKVSQSDKSATDIYRKMFS